MPLPPKSSAFFYIDDDGTKQDAALHNPILAGGDKQAAVNVSREVMREIGLSEEEIDMLLPQPIDKAKVQQMRERRKSMSKSLIERRKINREAKRLIGKKQYDASDRYEFMQQCMSDMRESGEAADEDEARSICELLWSEESDLYD